MSYNFILNGVQFPVTPSSLNITVNGRNELVTLIDEGEVNILKKPGLSDITFEVLLPNQRYPFARYTNGFQPAAYYIDALEKAIQKVDPITNKRQPVSFIVNRLSNSNTLLFDTNFDVSIENYTIEEDAEDLGLDVRCSITLKQYRAYGTKRLKTQAPATATAAPRVTVEKTRPTTNKANPKTYTVKSGDTLYNIAKKYLNDATRANEIARNNNIPNPNLIRVGQVLNL